jgi:hypothetical protein
LLLPALLVAAAVTIGPASARSDARRAATAQTWAVGISRANLALLSDPVARRARAAGLDTLLVDRARLSNRQWRRVQRLVNLFHFRRITRPHAAIASVKRGAKDCSAAKRRYPKRRCTLVADSLDSALRLAMSPHVDLVVARSPTLPALARLKRLQATRAQLVILVEIGRGHSLKTGLWRGAIKLASASNSLDLAVAPVGAHGSRLLDQYLGLLSNGSSSPPPPPPPPPPPLPPASVFIAPSGADSNPCSKAQPCRSFDRAYRVASPGAVVEVAAGSYPGQAIDPDSSKSSSSDVIFRPASGAAVSMSGELEANGSHFELRDMTLNQVNFPDSANDITLRNVVNHGMWWQGSSNISILGGEISCGACGYHSHMQNSGTHPPTNILFDGVYFHDWQSQGGEHVECLQILGGDGITIRNSVFKDCGTANGGLGATADLHLQAYSDPAPKNILLENDFFYPSGNPYVIQGEDFVNFDLRYNSLSGPILLYNGPSSGTGMDFVGNVLKASPCNAQDNVAAINWRYNVIQGGTCGPTDLNAPEGFLDPNSNLHLKPGAAAIDAGDPTSYPTSDIDGQSRFLGARPDAGADEAG